MTTPKFVRTLFVLVMAFGLALWTVGYASAADPPPPPGGGSWGCVGPGCNPSPPPPSGGGSWGCSGPGCNPQPAPPPGGGSWGCVGPGCNPPAQPPAQPAPNPPQQQVDTEHHDRSAFGAAAAGTMMGIAIGSMANQPQQQSPRQVVIIQQPAPPEGDPARLEELELEIERERQRARELEEKLEQLRSKRQR